MQMKTKSFKESFSKSTFYRFLDSAKTNWLRFTTLLSKKVIVSLEPLTSDDRINAFIVDGSLFERTSCKKTELGAMVFDHCDRRYKKGFRLLSLLWTDCNTAVPVNSCLLSSTQDKNVLGPETSFDRRSLAGQMIIPGSSEPPVRTLRATIPENENHRFRSFGATLRLLDYSFLYTVCARLGVTTDKGGSPL